MSEGRLCDGVVALARETGRGICEGERPWPGVLRSDNRGVPGLESISQSWPTMIQLSVVRSRFANRGRSGVIESID